MTDFETARWLRALERKIQPKWLQILANNFGLFSDMILGSGESEQILL